MKKNRKYFKFNGGDMELLFHKCKLTHSKRMLYEKIELRKKLTLQDVESAFELFKSADNIKNRKNDDDASYQHFYL